MMKKRLLSILLSFCMLLSTVSMMSITAFAETVDRTGWTEITGTTTISADGNYYLNSNVTGNIVVNGGVTATIDLNGYVLKASGEDMNNNATIINNGTLTINDSNNTTTHYFVVGEDDVWTLDTTKTSGIALESLTKRPEEGDVIAVKGGCITGGTGVKDVEGYGSIFNGGGVYSEGNITINDVAICGNNPKSDGGGIYSTRCTASINSCIICGNRSEIGGGIYSSSGNTQCDNCTISYNFADIGGGIDMQNDFELNNTKVCCNEAQYYGGGIAIDEATITLTVNGGEVSGNTASNEYDNGYAGGIYGFIATINLNGCAITNNYAQEYAGGIYLWAMNEENAGKLNITGEVVISGNTAGTETVFKNNVYLDNCFYSPEVTFDTSNPLTDGSSIGVTSGGLTPTAEAPVQFTTNGTNNDKKFFFSDNDAYGVRYNTAGYLELAFIDYAATPKMDYTAKLTLSKNIDMGIGVRKADGSVAIDADKLKIYADGEEVKLSDKLEGTMAKVSPKDIGTPTNISVEYDGVILNGFSYSVKNYCEAAFEAYAGSPEKYGKLNALCEAILNYGKYAEDYANGNTYSSVNAGHEIDFSQVTLPESQSSITPNTTYGSADSVASLALGSTIKLNYLVKTSEFVYGLHPQNFFIINEDNKQIDPEKISVSEVSGGYLISVDLYAYQLANRYTLKVMGVDTNKFQITLGVYDYCADVQGLTDPVFTNTLKTLCKAVYTYSEAAKNYTK